MKAWPTERIVTALIAHQGGWDEIALVVGPLLLVGLALWVANRRAAAQLKNTDAGQRSGTDD